MSEMITGMAFSGALMSWLMLLWLWGRVLACEKQQYTDVKEGMRWFDSLSGRIGACRSHLEALEHEQKELQNKVVLLDQLQYAETGVYNVQTDKETGAQRIVRAQQMEDTWLGQQGSRGPDDILEAAERIANARAKVHP